MGDMSNAYILGVNPEGKNHLEDGRVILEWILQKQGGGYVD
jgi:hypothetical protein